MKKLIAVLLIFIIVFSFIACKTKKAGSSGADAVAQHSPRVDEDARHQFVQRREHAEPLCSGQFVVVYDAYGLGKEAGQSPGSGTGDDRLVEVI